MFIIKHENENNYFKEFTDIGPRFTDNIEEAEHFEKRIDAALSTIRHFAFCMYDVVELK